MPKNLIVKDNALINASYNLDLVEQRLILLAIAQSRRTEQGLTATTKLKISVSDYIDVYSIQGRSVYENIKKACKSLFERQFTYTEQQEKGVRVATSRWVSEVAYNDETGTVDMIFAPSVVPLITMLEKQFTSYDLEQVAELSSKYAIRLYEIVSAWRSNGKTNQISVEELRDRLGVLKNEYSILADFKKRALKNSISEINGKTDLILSYEQHKQGRKIIGFTFTIKSKDKAKLPKALSNKTERNFETISILDNLTDEERTLIAQKMAYAAQKGITDPLHLQNLKKQALQQHQVAKKQEQERKQREQAERKAKKAKEQAEKLAREREEEKQAKLQKRRADALKRKFEALTHDEQEKILDQVEKNIGGPFAKFFKDARKAGTAHKNVMFMSWFFGALDI